LVAVLFLCYLFQTENNTHMMEPCSCIAAADGTRKYLFRFSQNIAVETVYIPEKDRHTLCVSTQAGCRMGCRFCHTGKMKLQAQLSTEQILAQITCVPEAKTLTNLVFMGMGEPFDNIDALFPALSVLMDQRQAIHFAPRRVSVSTAGVRPGIERYLQEFSSALSISVHSPFSEERADLMPIEKKWPIKTIMDSIRSAPISRHRRIFCEYLVIQDLNHSSAHASALASLLERIPARINLMRPHHTTNTAFPVATDNVMLSFRDALNEQGLVATIRRSRGIDIQAACGMLATKPSTSTK
jgi:23S rRNA (adenine2503-C2)-methyltransferase